RGGVADRIATLANRNATTQFEGRSRFLLADEILLLERDVLQERAEEESEQHDRNDVFLQVAISAVRACRQHAAKHEIASAEEKYAREQRHRVFERGRPHYVQQDAEEPNQQKKVRADDLITTRELQSRQQVKYRQRPKREAHCE